MCSKSDAEIKIELQSSNNYHHNFYIRGLRKVFVKFTITDKTRHVYRDRHDNDRAIVRLTISRYYLCERDSTSWRGVLDGTL